MNDGVKHYVCGFMFSRDMQRVVLIRKRRPSWQAGRCNGVGGKVEVGELSIQAMRREFFEETGLATVCDDWNELVVLGGEDSTYQVVFYWTTGTIDLVHSETDEEVFIAEVNKLPSNCITNLYWMIPLVQDQPTLKPLQVLSRTHDKV